MEKPNDDVYTLNELMEKLKITRRTLQNYIHDGKLVAFRVGNHWRVTRKQYEDFVEKNEKQQ
jgi:excisionase family DNA binding protein